MPASPGGHPGEFLISPVEGVLRVQKDVELDRETIAFYNLTICARDRGVPPLSSTVSLGTPSHWLSLLSAELLVETSASTLSASLLSSFSSSLLRPHYSYVPQAGLST